MRRVSTRMVEVPNLEVNVTDAAHEERLMRARDYVLRTAIPTVNEYVIQPFTGALKEGALAEATSAHGLDEHDLLRDGIKKDVVFGDIVLCVSAGPALSTKYEEVINDMKGAIRIAHARMRSGVEYISIPRIHSDFVHVLEEHSHPYNRLEVRLESAPERDEKSLLVLLDKGQYIMPSDKTAIEFAKAKSLRKNLESFATGVEEALAKQYGVTLDGAEIHQELSDGSGVRYLFFSKTSTEYSKVFEGLVGQKAKSVSSSSGDLDILEKRAFKPEYANARGKLHVATQSALGVGTTTITRDLQAGMDVRTYRVLKHCGVHVARDDVASMLSQLISAKSETGVQLKVDFFPAYK